MMVGTYLNGVSLINYRYEFRMVGHLYNYHVVLSQVWTSAFSIFIFSGK